MFIRQRDRQPSGPGANPAHTVVNAEVHIQAPEKAHAAGGNKQEAVQYIGHRTAEGKDPAVNHKGQRLNKAPGNGEPQHHIEIPLALQTLLRIFNPGKAQKRHQEDPQAVHNEDLSHIIQGQNTPHLVHSGKSAAFCTRQNPSLIYYTIPPFSKQAFLGK